MNNKAIEMIINKLSKQELKLLADVIKESLEKKKTEKGIAWMPEPGDTYYYLSSDGAAWSCKWAPEDGTYCGSSWNYESGEPCRGFGDPEDKQMWKLGNCFPTEADAAFAVEQLKVIMELRRFAATHNTTIDWKDIQQPKYFLSFDVKHNILLTDVTYEDIIPTVCFSSYDVAKDAIESVGKDRIKKYLFNI